MFLSEKKYNEKKLDYYQFTIKGYNSKTTKWKRGIGQGMRTGCRALCLLRACHSKSPRSHEPGAPITLVFESSVEKF